MGGSTMARPAEEVTPSPSTALTKPISRHIEPQPKTFPEARPAPMRFKEPSILADSPANNMLPAIPNQAAKQADSVRHIFYTGRLFELYTPERDIYSF
jgi:hypothetical protein